MVYKGLIMVGFITEVGLFILSGYLIALKDYPYYIVTLLLGLLMAIVVGKIIERNALTTVA